MIRITRLAAVVALLSIYGIASAQDNNRIESFPGEEQIVYATDIITGAQSVNEYLPLLKGCASLQSYRYGYREETRG